MIDKIREILTDITGDNYDNITENTIISEKWGSLTQMELVIALENEYNTKFSMKQIASMKTVKDILESINENT